MFVGFPPEMLPVQVLLPHRIETRTYEEAPDNRITEIERYLLCTIQ